MPSISTFLFSVLACLIFVLWISYFFRKTWLQGSDAVLDERARRLGLPPSERGTGRLRREREIGESTEVQSIS